MRIHKLVIMILLSAFVWVFGAELEFQLTGRVINSETHEAVFFVQVFLANTTIGTTTDKDGRFEIKREHFSPGTYQLIVHHVAFEMQTIELAVFQNTKQEMNVELAPKVWEGEQVEVTASDPREWKNRLERFLDIFIGQSDNVKYTTLTNPEVLNFYIDSETKEMVAHTDSVLHVENLALGYDLEIVLHDFRCSDFSREYLFYPRFIEKEPANEKQKKKWVENREKAWYGSYRHFMRTLVLTASSKGKKQAKRLVKKWEMPTESTFNIFDLYQKDKKFIVYPGFIDASKDFRHTYTNAPAPFEINELESQYSLGFNGWLQVFYNYERLPEASYIRLLDGLSFTLLDTLGNETSRASVMKGGRWLREGMAELLPRDYLP